MSLGTDLGRKNGYSHFFCPVGTTPVCIRLGYQICGNYVMEKYKNHQGKSGVLAYEIGEDYIKIRFQGNETYVYNETRPGKAKVEKMKQLAVSGLGLSTYISQHVRDDYFEKVDA